MTLFRIVIGLPVIIALGSKNLYVAWILILLGGFSDIADGVLARRAGKTSDWGARLDPLADKILLLAPLLWLAKESILPIWSIWVLITRELIISLWRSYQDKGGPASLAGKTKTILQFISILLMIWPNELGGEEFAKFLQILGCYLFWVSLIIALLSAFKYLKIQSKFDLN